MSDTPDEVTPDDADQPDDGFGDFEEEDAFDASDEPG